MTRRIFFYCAWGILLYVVFELAVAGGLGVLEKMKVRVYEPPMRVSKASALAWEKFFNPSPGQTSIPAIKLDPLLGWVSNPGGRWRRFIRINDQGLRSDRHYAVDPPSGVRRVAAFGDSFTAGAEVELNETWAYRLEQKGPGLEVLNYGIGGYGLDQSFLRYRREGALLHPHVVLIGYSDAIMRRQLNRFRPFRHAAGVWPLTKPRFVIERGRLVLVPNYFASPGNVKRFLLEPDKAVREIAKGDHFCEPSFFLAGLDFLPSVRFLKTAHRRMIESRQIVKTSRGDWVYQTSAEAYQITIRLIDLFYQEVIRQGAVPAVLIFPGAEDFRRVLRKRSCVYAPLLASLRERGYATLDLMPAFTGTLSEGNLSDFFAEDGYHYGALGNRLVAENLADFLKTLERSFEKGGSHDVS